MRKEMLATLKLNKKGNTEVTAYIKILDKTYLDRIMVLQQHVVEGMVDQALFISSDYEEMANHFEDDSVVIGVITEKNELVGVGIYIEAGETEHNYGYDLGIRGKALNAIGQIDTIIVDEMFRGNGLQHKICLLLEEICKQREKEMLCATVSPQNDYSVNNLLKAGFEIKEDKLKYGGFRRYVVAKKLN